MKRILIFLLSLLIVSAVSGCTKSQEPQAASNAPSTTETALKSEKLTPAQRREQILATRQKNWDDEQKRNDYVSQKIEENGGRYWEDEETGSVHYKGSSENIRDYNLTDEQLKSDTKTLLDLVLEKKIMFESLIFSSDFNYNRLYTGCAQRCNGLRELELREDIGDVLFEKYKQEYKKTKEHEPGTVETYLGELDMMLEQEIYGIWLTSAQVDEINRIRVERRGGNDSTDVIPYVYIPNYSLRD